MKFLFFFCWCLFAIARKCLYISVLWPQFLCRMQYFLTVLGSTEDSSFDTTTLELYSSHFFFFVNFLFMGFLAAVEDFFFFRLQVFYSIFKEIALFFDSRIFIIDLLLNHLVFLCSRHGMVDDVHDVICRKRCRFLSIFMWRKLC